MRSKRFSGFTQAIIKWLDLSLSFSSSEQLGDKPHFSRACINDAIANFHEYFSHYPVDLSIDFINDIKKMQVNLKLQDAIAIDEVTAWYHLLFKIWYLGAEQFSRTLNLRSVRNLPSELFSGANTAEVFENEDDILNKFMETVVNWKYDGSKRWNNPDLYFVAESIEIKHKRTNTRKGIAVFKTQNYYDNGNPSGISIVITHPSLFEATFSETFMVMPNLLKKFKTGANYLSSAEGIVIALNNPRNPRVGAISIEWQTMTIEQRNMATSRARVHYTDVISYINNVKDWCVDLKTGHDWIGGRYKKVLPFTDKNSFYQYYSQHDDFRAKVDEVVINRIKKHCFGDIMEYFIDGGYNGGPGKNKFIQYEFSMITDPNDFYAIRKQLDFLMAFKSAGTTAILVVKSPAMKKVVLEMRQSLGYDFPVLTEREHLALETARWHAYQDMCVTKHADGTFTTDRSKFSYERFIRELHMHSDASIDHYWNIDPAIAKLIMMSFGFDEHGHIITNDLEWIGSPKSKFPYLHAHALILMGWWNRFNSDLCHVEAEIQYGVWS